MASSASRPVSASITREPLHLQDLADAGPDPVFVIDDQDSALFHRVHPWEWPPTGGSRFFLDHLEELLAGDRLVEEGVQLGPLLEPFRLLIETAARRRGDPRKHDDGHLLESIVLARI